MMQLREQAVSPVVGVMLMLVVTIIIAAVVSAFAGGAIGSQTKTPQATIKGVFSQSGGMQIINTGGDTLSAANLMFTVVDDDNFGQGLSSTTVQILSPQIITDSNGNALMNNDGSSNVTSFKPGQTLYISQSNINCGILQPQIADGNQNYYSYSGASGWQYKGSKYNLWSLCFANPDSVGKTFSLTMSDKSSGAVIAKTTVTISP